MQGTSWGGDVIVMVNVIYLDHYELELLVQNEVSEECILSPGNALGCLWLLCSLIMMNGQLYQPQPKYDKVRGQTF